MEFNGKKARKIREREGLSLAELVKILGFSQNSRNRIGSFEREEYIPSNPPEGKLAEAYLGWLRSKGYGSWKK